jgi:hypothetical protein
MATQVAHAHDRETELFHNVTPTPRVIERSLAVSRRSG